MNTPPQNALKILQLLLRCGMICREELNVVLEMMPAIPPANTDPRIRQSSLIDNNSASS